MWISCRRSERSCLLNFANTAKTTLRNIQTYLPPEVTDNHVLKKIILLNTKTSGSGPVDRGVYILCLLCPPRVHSRQCCCKNRCKSETNFKIALKLIKEYLMILPYQRLTAAKSRKSKEGRDDEDGEGNTYCELALLPKRSEFKHWTPNKWIGIDLSSALPLVFRKITLAEKTTYSYNGLEDFLVERKKLMSCPGTLILTEMQAMQ